MEPKGHLYVAYNIGNKTEESPRAHKSPQGAYEELTSPAQTEKQWAKSERTSDIGNQNEQMNVGNQSRRSSRQTMAMRYLNELDRPGFVQRQGRFMNGWEQLSCQPNHHQNDRPIRYTFALPSSSTVSSSFASPLPPLSIAASPAAPSRYATMNPPSPRVSWSPSLAKTRSQSLRAVDITLKSSSAMPPMNAGVFANEPTVCSEDMTNTRVSNKITQSIAFLLNARRREDQSLKVHPTSVIQNGNQHQSLPASMVFLAETLPNNRVSKAQSPSLSSNDNSTAINPELSPSPHRDTVPSATSPPKQSSNHTKQSCKTTAPATAKKARKRRYCQHEGCPNYVIDHGLCISHGGGKRCYIEDCGCRAQSYGLCWKHGGYKMCTVDGCKKRAKSRGFCWSHGGGTKCKHEDGCDTVAVSRGLCWAHGGGKRCLVDDCRKPASQKYQNLCASHFRERNV